MENTSYFRAFARHSVLSVLGTLGVSCYILADTFFVAQGLGTDGLTALNLAIPVYNFIHGSGLMLGMGGATLFSVALGKQEPNADRIYSQTLCLAAVFSGFFFLIGLFLPVSLARLFGADASVLGRTATYLRWLLLFSPAFILNDILLCFVRNDHAPGLSSAAMLTGSFMNILLDYIFIFPLKMDIFGAVFATGISPVLSILVMTPHWIRRKNTFHLQKPQTDRGLIGKILSVGFPSLLTQLSSGVVMIAFNQIILRLSGNTGVAAYSVTANLSLVVSAVYIGIAQGVQPLISRLHGENNARGIQKMRRYANRTALLFSSILYLLIFLCAEPITAVFNSAHDPQLQTIAVEGLKLYFLSVWFVGYNTVLSVYFPCIGQEKRAHILSWLRGLLLIVPAALLLSAVFGMTGVWLSYPITELLVAGIGCYMLRKRHICKQTETF